MAMKGQLTCGLQLLVVNRKWNRYLIWYFRSFAVKKVSDGWRDRNKFIQTLTVSFLFLSSTRELSIDKVNVYTARNSLFKTFNTGSWNPQSLLDAPTINFWYFFQINVYATFQATFSIAIQEECHYVCSRKRNRTSFINCELTYK